MSREKRVREQDENSSPETRSPYSWLVRWTLLEVNRLYIACILSGGIFLGCLLLAWADLLVLGDSEPLTLLLSSLIGGMLPFITVVLAIVQLILSKEFGTTGTFRDRLETTEEFRRRVEADTGIDVSPVEPRRFLEVVMEAVRERGEHLGELDGVNATDAPALDRFARDLVTYAQGAKRRLAGAEFGTFEIISVLLDYNDSTYLHVTHRLQVENGDAAPSGVQETLAEIERLLEDVHVVRQYFKIVHVQQELANLSQLLLYVGLPALVAGSFLVLIYDNLLTMFPGVWPLLLVSGTVTIVFSPFTILFAFVLRIATIARRTAADFGPFRLQQKPLYRDEEE